MEDQFQDNIDNIRDWIKSESYKEANYHFDKDSGYFIADYVAEYFLLSEDLDDDEELNTTEIPLTVYIKNENEFKLEFNKPLFKWFFKGYETEENISAVEDFMELAMKGGYTL